MDKNSIMSALDEYADKGLLNAADLRPAVLSRVREITAPRSGGGLRFGFAPRGLALAGLMLALLLAGAVVFPGLLVQTKPVSAAEILARAGAASQPGSLASNTNGVRSTHAVMSIRARNSPTDQFIETQSEWWDQAPDKSRTETTLSTSDGKVDHIILGSVGTTSYMPSAGGTEFHIYTRSNAATSVGTDLGTATRLVSDWAGLHVYDAVLTGTEAVAGRMAYVLDLKVKQDALGVSVTQYRKKIWIDQQAYLVLREQDWDKNGVLLYEVTCQSLEVNSNLNAALFDFKPPAGSIVMDMRPATNTEIASGWNDAAGKLRTPVFRVPEASYSNWLAGRPYYEPAEGVLTQAFTDDTGAHARNSGAPSLLISEGPSSGLTLRVQGWGAGRQVKIGSSQGRIYRQGQACALIFDRAGTQIILYLPSNAAQLQSTLIPTAESMQIVSKK